MITSGMGIAYGEGNFWDAWERAIKGSGFGHENVGLSWDLWQKAIAFQG